MLVEIFVPEMPIQGFSAAVLHGHSWLDEAVLDQILAAPLVGDPAGDLRGAVCDDDLLPALIVDDSIQHPPHPKIRKDGVLREGKTLAVDGIDHIQGP